ncbi:MAG: Rne/Rng family ribonuclease, partial [Parvularculaceae bacterium]
GDTTTTANAISVDTGVDPIAPAGANDDQIIEDLDAEAEGDFGAVEEIVEPEEDPDEEKLAAAEDADGEAADDDGNDDGNDDGEDETPEARESRRELLERYREARRNRQRLLRGYKIQEVIKRRQILLIQVVKEERGNKGAALTTYMSLAGRYCVLMPNTARGGGISRKIPNASDRKRLRKVVDGLDVTQGMGLIIRTAGAKRTKAEIKRDYDYLTRLWETIRELTLKSIAPALIYEEASLIKRAIRDLYDKDIDKVLVEGEGGYREAKDFMKMLMPSHAKNVQPYKDATPLFLRNKVETQLDAMFKPEVRLKSGGYLVINQTEALVSVDVNSGKATRERNIEQTALKTNIEAAKELARQCRLRDLAGLIVVDFIDMEENRNNRAVEKKFKEALRTDRARIQVGRISSFGLLEMSRQRRRSGIVDGTTTACPTCDGAGVVRSNETAGLRILRAVESEAIDGKAGTLNIKTSIDVAMYILNFKRDWLRRIEENYGVNIELTADATKTGDQYAIEKSASRRTPAPVPTAVRADLSETDADAAEEQATGSKEASEKEEEPSGRKRRRRKRRRRSEEDQSESNAPQEVDTAATDQPPEQAGEETKTADGDEASDEEGEKQRRRRRRGRRGGRRNRRGGEQDVAAETSANTDAETTVSAPEMTADNNTQTPDTGASAETKNEDTAAVVTGPITEASEAPSSKEVSSQEAPVAPDGTTDAPEVDSPDSAAEEALKAEEIPAKPTRKGWWQRALGG